jgi:hypothetical protein
VDGTTASVSEATTTDATTEEVTTTEKKTTEESTTAEGTTEEQSSTDDNKEGGADWAKGAGKVVQFIIKIIELFYGDESNQK